MYSFDIFDTLITRKTYSPYGIFSIMKDKLIRLQKDSMDISANEWVSSFDSLRIRAEQSIRAVFSYQNREDVTLSDIYSELSNILCDDTFDLEGLKHLEVETELENIVPIYSGIEIVKKLYNDGEKVVLISDMYLSSDVIRQMLCKFDACFSNIPIYVSCEFGKTKRSGSLYIEVKKQENADYKNWVHYGDNIRSDVNIPQLLGITANPVCYEELLQWEKEFLKKANMVDDSAVQIYFGISRYIRQNTVLSHAGQIGASLGGMVFFPYIYWIIKKSVKLGIKRLYFVARDGYVLKLIADEVISRYQLPLQTYYIYGSRMAWRVKPTDAQYEQMTAYLEQEVDSTDNVFAFVDLNGTGYTMNCVGEVLYKKTGLKMRSFYYTFWGAESYPYCECFHYSNGDGNLCEVLCRAPHGCTEGYSIKEGKVVPQLSAFADSEFWHCGMSEYLEGIKLYAKTLADATAQITFIHTGAKHISEDILKYLQNPEIGIVEFIGNIPHHEKQKDNGSLYAPKLSRKDIFRIYMWRTHELWSEVYTGMNIRYSLLRTSPKNLKYKEFLEKHYNKVYGKMIHGLKQIIEKRPCKKGYNVIIYGAGQYGIKNYSSIKYNTNNKVVAWTDIDYKKLQEKGMSVVSLKTAKEKKYDYIVIAIKDELVFSTTKKLLVETGVPFEKILSVEEFFTING